MKYLPREVIIKQLKEKLKIVPIQERQKKIIEYRFGLDDGFTHTLEETGKMFGITRERIRQIEIKTLEELDIKVYE